MDKISSSLEKGFDSEPVYNNKYRKIKINLHNGKINTDFQNNKIPEQGVCYFFFFFILLDSIAKVGKKILSANTFRTM